MSYNNVYGMSVVKMINGLPTSAKCPACGVWFTAEVDDSGDDIVCPCCFEVFTLDEED